MGTRFEITGIHRDDQGAWDGINAAISKVTRIEKYRIPLEKVGDRYGVVQRHHYGLKKIQRPKRCATFTVTDAEGETSEIEKKFEMIHVTPSQSSSYFVKSSPLADENG